MNKDFIIEQLTEGSPLSIKTANIIGKSYSVIFPSDDLIREFCKAMGFLKDSETSENRNAARKMTLNPNFPIDRLPTLIKKLIEEYRAIHNVHSALNDAKFESDDDINRSLAAYRFFKRELMVMKMRQDWRHLLG